MWVGELCFFWFCDVVGYVLSSFTTISLKVIELVALLLFYSYFYVGGFACLCLMSFSHGYVAWSVGPLSLIYESQLNDFSSVLNH